MTPALFSDPVGQAIGDVLGRRLEREHRVQLAGLRLPRWLAAVDEEEPERVAEAMVERILLGDAEPELRDQVADMVENYGHWLATISVVLRDVRFGELAEGGQRNLAVARAFEIIVFEGALISLAAGDPVEQVAARMRLAGIRVGAEALERIAATL
jgi:hypothetical protein